VLLCAASALVVPLAFRAGARLAGTGVGAWSAVAWALHPTAVLGATGWPQSTNLFALVATACVLSFVEVETSDARDGVRGAPARRAVGSAAALFAASLWLEPLLLPVVAAWGAVALLRRRLRLALAIALVGVAGLVAVAPWLARNAVALGEPVFLRSRGGPELLLGAVAGPGEPTPAHLDPTRDPRELARLAEIGEARWAAEKREEALALIRQRPARWVAACAWRYGVFWLGRASWWRAAPGHPLGGGALTAARGAIFAVPAVLAVAGLLALRPSRPAEVRLLAVVLAAWPVTYSLTHVEARYRLPVEPLVTVLAVAGVAAIVGWTTRREGGMLSGSRPEDP
jgi:hypothetical protein